jgi:hypothetical protein
VDVSSIVLLEDSASHSGFVLDKDGHLGPKEDVRPSKDASGKSPAAEDIGATGNSTYDRDSVFPRRDLPTDPSGNAGTRDLDNSDGGVSESAVTPKKVPKKVPKKKKTKKSKKVKPTKESKKIAALERSVSALHEGQDKLMKLLQASLNKEDPPQDSDHEEDQEGIFLHTSDVSLSSEEEVVDFKRKASPVKKPPPKKQKVLLTPVTSTDESDAGQEDQEAEGDHSKEDAQDQKTFAQTKMSLSAIIQEPGQETRFHPSSLIVERKLCKTAEEDLLDFKLPLSTVVKEALTKTNASVRGVPLEVMNKIPFVWKVEDLPPVGQKAKSASVIKRPEAGLKESRKNHYLTVEIPYSAENKSNGDFQKQVLAASRRDALDLLQCQSYTEQALGATAILLKDEERSKEKSDQAAQFLLSAARCLVSQVSLTSRILGNTTLACRNLDLPTVTGLTADYTKSLMTVPIQTQQPICPDILADMRRLQSKELPTVGVLCQEMSQDIAGRKKGLVRGRGRGFGSRRQPKPQAAKQQPPQQSNRGRGGYHQRHRGSKNRGRGRGFQPKVSASQASQSSK